MTPAARALLRSAGISLDGRDDLPAVIRLADAHALTHTAATATTAPASTATPTPHTAPVAPPGSGPASATGGRVVVGIGAPTQRVVPHVRDDGQQLITFASTVEVWVHGGEKHFAAGADIGRLAEMTFEDVVGWNARLQQAFSSAAVERGRPAGEH
jgi:hypothetical protein